VDGTGSGNGFSTASVLSANGRYVAFWSTASNLVQSDTNNQQDVFVRDLEAKTTILVSVNRTNTAGGNNGSCCPVLSANGRYVAFTSSATDLVFEADTLNGSDVFVRDLRKGRTILASVNHTGTAAGNGFSNNPAISADGQSVKFQSQASDLVADDTNGRADVFVRNIHKRTTTLVSVNYSGTDSGNGPSESPRSAAFSADGRYVAFWSTASNLVETDTNGLADAFVHDLKTGKTTLLSAERIGLDSGNNFSTLPVLSANGHWVAFDSIASDLVVNDTNGTTDVFVRAVP
jgi:Tol biopolymer transport system component